MTDLHYDLICCRNSREALGKVFEVREIRDLADKAVQPSSTTPPSLNTDRRLEDDEKTRG
jgi:hypothetical protein